MYKPQHFSVDDQTALQLIHEFPFATVISVDSKGLPTANHLPLLLDETKSQLLGHVSRKNTQWHEFERQAPALAIFHGPHAYITPKWYRSGVDVPTWNYAVVQVTGKTRLIGEHAELIELLQRLTDRFEGAETDRWRFELPDDLATPASIANAIVGFEIAIETVEAKFKLSQNRSAEDRAGIIDGLASRSDEQSRLVREWMRRK